MFFFSPDIILFSVFLVVNLIVGLGGGRRVKTLRDFSIGNKDFSTATLTSTIVSTWIGGGFMFYALENIYNTGLQFIIITIGGTLSLLFIGQVLAVRMGEFLSNLSVAEAMGNLYGTTVRVIAAISGILRAIGSIAIQLQVIVKMLALLLGVKGPEITIVAATIVILYSAFGGIRSVIITDLFQFVTFVVFVPILALIVWNHLKDPAKVTSTLSTNPIFSLKQTVGWNMQSLHALGLFLYFMVPGLNPPIFQRIAMAKNVNQVKSSFTYAALIRLGVVISVAWISVLLLSDNPGLGPTGVVNHLITEYAYPGLKGLIAISITAMAMSTADSDLNAAAVLGLHDLAKLIKPSWENSITLVRVFSVLLGGFALLLALHTTDLLQLLLLSGSFYMPIVTVPLLLAIFGFRSSPRAVLIGMAAGFITVALWDKLLGSTGINNLIPAMLANVLFFISSHYLLKEPGGWVGIKVSAPLEAARQERRDAWINFVNNIKTTKIYDYLQKNLPGYEIVYSLFAIYVIGATYASFYTVPEDIVTKYATLYNFIYHSVLIVTAAFLTYPAWPPTFKSKKFITYAWPAGILYILFIVGSILVAMSGFHQVQVMIFLLNLVMAAFVLSWPLMLFLSMLGILLGYLAFKTYCGGMYYCPGVVDSGQFKLIYSILLVSSFLIALFRFKQNQTKLENKNTYLTTLYEEKSNDLAQILAYREQVLKELNDDERALFDHTTSAYLQQIIYRMVDYIRLEVTKINLNELLLEVKEALQLTELPTVPQLIINKNTREEAINADLTKIKQLLVNGILYVCQHNLTNQPIKIILEDAKLGHSIDYIKDYTRQLLALKFTITIEETLPDKKEIYMLDQVPSISQFDLPKEERELVENARIIHAHYGYAEFGNGYTQVYVLPLNVREIRGKVMELLREPAVADPLEVQHPLAMQLEEELLDKIKGMKIDVRVVRKALDTIKKYHARVKRKSGEPFFTHPISVAIILLEYCQDQDALVAALLHDTVEDTSLSLVQIKAIFGEEVAFIVDKVTNLEDKLRRISLQEHENLYRLVNYEDERAAYVKLADRLHNMRTIQGHSSLEKQKSIANETLSFFVILAKNLGLNAVAQELEKRSLEVLAKK